MINTEHVETAVLWWEPWTPVLSKCIYFSVYICYTAIHSEMVININTSLK